MPLSDYQPDHEDGAGHDRNVAFHWWFRRKPLEDALEKLLWLAKLAPALFHFLLAKDVRRPRGLTSN